MIRLEYKVSKVPRGIIVELYDNGEYKGFRNIGGDVEGLTSLEWKKVCTEEGYTVYTEFEADIEYRNEVNRSGKEVERVYLTNIRRKDGKH